MTLEQKFHLLYDTYFAAMLKRLHANENLDRLFSPAGLQQVRLIIPEVTRGHLADGPEGAVAAAHAMNAWLDARGSGAL